MTEKPEAAELVLIPEHNATVLVRRVPLRKQVKWAEQYRVKGTDERLVNRRKFESRLVAYGLVEPKLSVADAELLDQRSGAAFKRIVDAIKALDEE